MKYAYTQVYYYILTSHCHVVECKFYEIVLHAAVLQYHPSFPSPHAAVKRIIIIVPIVRKTLKKNIEKLIIKYLLLNLFRT